MPHKYVEPATACVGLRAGHWAYQPGLHHAHPAFSL